MRTLFASLISTAVTASNVPGFAAVGPHYKCEKGFWNFATSYYTTKEQRAIDDCERLNCDLIIEWTKRKNNNKVDKFYDIGMFEGEICEQKEVYSTKVIRQKLRNTNTSGSNFTATGTHFGNIDQQLFLREILAMGWLVGMVNLVILFGVLW